MIGFWVRLLGFLECHEQTAFIVAHGPLWAKLTASPSSAIHALSKSSAITTYMPFQFRPLIMNYGLSLSKAEAAPSFPRSFSTP